MSNNIYDILKKIESLEAPKKTLTESKMNTVKELHNESKKEKSSNKGTIAEAVAQVEQQLNEKYMGFKKTVAAIKKGGSAENPEAVAAAIGRKKYGKAKFQKAAAAGKKLGEGEVEESGLQAYLGKKKYGKEGMTALQKAGREGASKEKMAKIRAHHDKMDEALRGINIDGTDPAHPGERKAIAQQIKTKRAANRADPTMSDTMPGMRKRPQYGQDSGGQHVVHRNERQIGEANANEDMLSPKEKSFAALAEPKDKITYADKIAGAKKGKKTEGNKFSGNLMKARAQGLKQADLDGDGDMEKVTPGKSNMREGWEEMQKYLDKKKGPQSKGGEGKKAGTRYGGSAQKDDDEEEKDGEGKPIPKKRKKAGRPDGTASGARHNYKKPKD